LMVPQSRSSEMVLVLPANFGSFPRAFFCKSLFVLIEWRRCGEGRYFWRFFFSPSFLEGGFLPPPALLRVDVSVFQHYGESSPFSAMGQNGFLVLAQTDRPLVLFCRFFPSLPPCGALRRPCRLDSHRVAAPLPPRLSFLFPPTLVRHGSRQV